MQFDLVIKNGTVYTEKGFHKLNVGAKGEKIAVLAEPGVELSGSVELAGSVKPAVPSVLPSAGASELALLPAGVPEEAGGDSWRQPAARSSTAHRAPAINRFFIGIPFLPVRMVPCRERMCWCYRVSRGVSGAFCARRR